MQFNGIEGNDCGDVRLYALSTCVWCRKTKEFLKGSGVCFEYIDVDKLEKEEKREIVAYLDGLAERWGFPVMLVDGKDVIVGFKAMQIIERLGLDPESVDYGVVFDVDDELVDDALEKLEIVSNKNGYYLNPDRGFTKSLVRSLLINQERHDYRACPCRLASGEREEDRDILCPCDYRDPDLEEYGCCYCALFVSKEKLENPEQIEPMPERRKVKS